MARYEKVNDTTLKLTREVSQEINVPKLVVGRKQIIEDMAILQEKLDHVNEALAKAEDLGMDITTEPKKVIDESENHENSKKA